MMADVVEILTHLNDIIDKLTKDWTAIVAMSYYLPQDIDVHADFRCKDGYQ